MQVVKGRREEEKGREGKEMNVIEKGRERDTGR